VTARGEGRHGGRAGRIVLGMDDDLHRRPCRAAGECSAGPQERPDSENLRFAVASRLEGFRRLNEWESREERTYLPFECVLRCLDELRMLASRDTRTRAFDSEQAGVRRMHEILGRLKSATRSTGGPR
jgi:hypothetical protein